MYTHLRSLLVASLLICLLACNLSADTPPIRVSIEVECETCDNAGMLSALSHEFRKLDGVSVTDTQPALKVRCLVFQLTPTQNDPIKGYAASVALTSIDDHFIGHLVFIGATIDALAHSIAIAVDGNVIEQMRRDAQPSSSP